ncbi:MAG TPA: hypothetical protein VF593_12300 [Chthoniobacteraceae bacterium]|jgi:hypothetical protein
MRLLILSLVILSNSLLAQTSTTTAAAPAKFPALRVQVAVGTQQRRIGDSYRKTMEIVPKVTVEGASRLIPLPAAEGVMLIVTMDTRAKYTGNREVYSVLTADTLPIPAAPNGDRRQFSFPESQVTFDSYRDASNVGGAVYKYYVFGVRDVATKAVVDFQTNHPQLATFVKTHPEKRDELLALKKGAKFPAEFK